MTITIPSTSTVEHSARLQPNRRSIAFTTGKRTATLKTETKIMSRTSVIETSAQATATVAATSENRPDRYRGLDLGATGVAGSRGGLCGGHLLFIPTGADDLQVAHRAHALDRDREDDSVDGGERFVALRLRELVGAGDALHDQCRRWPDFLGQELGAAGDGRRRIRLLVPRTQSDAQPVRCTSRAAAPNSSAPDRRAGRGAASYAMRSDCTPDTITQNA